MSLSYQFSNFLLKCVTYELALVAKWKPPETPAGYWWW